MPPGFGVCLWHVTASHLPGTSTDGDNSHLQRHSLDATGWCWSRVVLILMQRFFVSLFYRIDASVFLPSPQCLSTRRSACQVKGGSGKMWVPPAVMTESTTDHCRAESQTCPILFSPSAWCMRAFESASNSSATSFDKTVVIAKRQPWSSSSRPRSAFKDTIPGNGRFVGVRGWYLSYGLFCRVSYQRHQKHTHNLKG